MTSNSRPASPTTTNDWSHATVDLLSRPSAPPSTLAASSVTLESPRPINKSSGGALGSYPIRGNMLARFDDELGFNQLLPDWEARVGRGAFGGPTWRASKGQGTFPAHPSHELATSAWSVAKRSEGSRGQHIAYSFGTPEEASRMRELGWNADYLMHSAYNHEQLDVATCKVDGQTFPIRTLFDLLDGHYPELGEILSNAQTHNQASEWISLHLVAPHARGFVIDGSLHLLHVEVIAVKPDWDSLSFGGVGGIT